MQFNYNLQPVDFAGQYMRGKTFRAEREAAEEAKADREKIRQLQEAEKREREMMQDARQIKYMLENNMINDAQDYTIGRLQKITDKGGDTSDTEAVLGDLVAGNPTQALGRINSYLAGMGKLQSSAEKKEFKKGEGALVFDPNTGSYSIDPVAQAELDKIAQKKQQGVKLSLDDKRKLNQDISKFTKSAVDIRGTAQELETLSKKPSGPASIAAVFKFMKALDPQSVVRESEFATAENSAGVPEYVRNIYNRILDGERLGEKQFKQFVDTAKQLSNSATSSARQEAERYLFPMEDEFSSEFRNKLLKRVPDLFEIQTVTEDDEKENERSIDDLINQYGG